MAHLGNSTSQTKAERKVPIAEKTRNKIQSRWSIEFIAGLPIVGVARFAAPNRPADKTLRRFPGDPGTEPNSTFSGSVPAGALVRRFPGLMERVL
jgi:hypothetical protein